jgi:PAS domain S-box-containing protein
MSSARKTIAAACLLLLAQGAVLVTKGTKPPGPFLSDLLQLILGLLCVIASYQASRRSDSLGRHFWKLTTICYLLWVLAQGVETYGDLHELPNSLNWLDNFLYAFWFTPLGMALFLDPNFEPRGFDWLFVLDFFQAVLFWVAGYFYFFYIPSRSPSADELLHTMWAPYFIYYAVIAGSFLLRAALAGSPIVRALFGRMGLFFVLSGAIDFLYYHGPGQSLATGDWFDILWGMSLVIPASIAGTWSTPAGQRLPAVPVQSRNLVVAQSFPLLYPILVLVLSAQIARAQIVMASVVVLASFLCSSTRLLMTQYRQQKALAALAASEARFRSLFEDNLAGVFRTTPGGQLLECNQAFVQMFGYASRDELLSLPVNVLYDHAGERGEQVRLLHQEGALTNVETRLRRKNGDPVWVLQNITLMRDKQGLEVIEGTLVDITERKRLEEQLVQSQKMEAIGRLAGGVAHDFNNLLCVILGYADLQLEHAPRDESLQESAEAIRKAANRAAELTRQLLAFSRRQLLQPKVLDLNQVVHDTEGLIRRLIGEDIEFVVVEGTGLGRVKADPGQVTQVLMNLAVNARDAMPRGGKLTVETANVELYETYAEGQASYPPGSYVMLAVSDTGEGIDAETQARIFEPFFTTKEKGKGTGLGLATSYGAVKQSGGFIGVCSEPGKGTTFRVYFPREEEPLGPAIAEPRVGEPLTGTETILLVEDEEALRNLTRNLLGTLGYTVLEGADGAEALEMARSYRGPIHVLLTDVVMPKLGGCQLAHELEQLHPEAKVLFVSGYTDDAVVRQGDAGTGRVLLQKPFDSDTLARKVREILDTRNGN